MDRRRFLQLGLAGGAVLAVGGAGLGLWPGARRYAPRGPLAALDAMTFNVLAAVAARVAPPTADPVAVAQAVDATLVLGPPEVAHDVRELLHALESALVGLVLDGRPRPFTRLAPAEQDVALGRWRDSRLVVRRSGYRALRKLVVGAYYADPRTWQAIGYPGPPPPVEPPEKTG